MTIQEFKKTFCFRVEIQNTGVILTIITKAIRKSDNKVVDGVKTQIDIQETHDWIAESNCMISVIPWNWELYIDETKRFQLAYFAQRAPIENWHPTNTDISDLYCD